MVALKPQLGDDGGQGAKRKQERRGGIETLEAKRQAEEAYRGSRNAVVALKQDNGSPHASVH